MVPEELGISLDDALEKSDDLRKTYDTDGEIRELLDFARKIEGLARNVGTHAAAVVIADKPLTEYVPLGRVSGKDDIITQWSMGDVEAAGLLKMDFLGLRNLTILRRAIDLIKQTTGKDLDILKLPLDDKATFELLQRGETKGVFQLESGGIRDLLQKMKPDSFHDIIATHALYRPGPLEGGMVEDYVAIKHGRKQAEYKHPVLEDVLSETYGIMIYQEQVMRILNRLGDIPLASAYTCIKAISKKKESLIQQNYEQFIKGATENGLSKAEAEEIWNLIVKFAGYGFNKSHSTAYALVAYQTAYLKAHYPVEFMAALLSGDIPGRNFKRKDAMVEHLEDCARMGIEVIPPSVNHSDADFSVKDGKIHFGLAAVKGCGGSASEVIEDARRKGGPFTDIFDFCERVDPQGCGRSTIETLIKAGAMDGFGARRKQLMAVIDKAMQAGAKALADRRAGQKNLFGGFDEEETTTAARPAADLPDIPEFEERERLLMEKEVLGFYLSSHPLAEYEKTLDSFCTHKTTQLGDVPARAEVVLGGMISAIKPAHIRKVRPGQVHTKYANFDLEDKDGAVRCIIWPEEFAKYGHLLQPDAVLILRGAVDRRGGGDECNIICNELIALDEMESRCTRGVKIRIDEARHGGDSLAKLREIIRFYPGDGEVQLLLNLENGSQVHLAVGKYRVRVNDELRRRVDDLLGVGNLQLITEAPRPTNGNGNGNGNGYRGRGKAAAS